MWLQFPEGARSFWCLPDLGWQHVPLFPHRAILSPASRRHSLWPPLPAPVHRLEKWSLVALILASGSREGAGGSFAMRHSHWRGGVNAGDDLHRGWLHLVTGAGPGSIIRLYAASACNSTRSAAVQNINSDFVLRCKTNLNRSVLMKNMKDSKPDFVLHTVSNLCHTTGMA